MAQTGREVHIFCANEQAAPEAGPGFPEEIESNDERCGEVFFEERLGIGRGSNGLKGTLAGLQAKVSV